MFASFREANYYEGVGEEEDTSEEELTNNDI